MSRLKIPYHIRFSDFPQFIDAWKNTPPDELVGWDIVAANNRVSTLALVWSIWQTITFQLNDPNIINKFYVQWRWHHVTLFWPYGTGEIPLATLGLAKCGETVLALTEQNALV